MPEHSDEHLPTVIEQFERDHPGVLDEARAELRAKWGGARQKEDEVGHIARETDESPHTRWVIGSGASLPQGGPTELEWATQRLQEEVADRLAKQGLAAAIAKTQRRLNLVLLFLSGGLIAEGLRILLGK